MGKAAEMLKDKGGVVSSFPADALHDTVPQCSCPGTALVPLGNLVAASHGHTHLGWKMFVLLASRPTY